MKTKDVLNILGITRVTLCHYVTSGKVKVTKLDSGRYDYDEDSVMKLLKKDNRKNIIYCRVSTYKQKKDLENQISFIKNYCSINDIAIDDKNIYSEIASGLDFDRKEFSKLVNDVMNYRIKNIYITNKDRLTRLSFSLLQNIFSKFGTTIVITNNKNTTNEDELFEDLISIMHVFSTSMYSKRKQEKLQIMKKDIQNFNKTKEA